MNKFLKRLLVLMLKPFEKIIVMIAIKLLNKKFNCAFDSIKNDIEELYGDNFSLSILLTDQMNSNPELSQVWTKVQNMSIDELLARRDEFITQDLLNEDDEFEYTAIMNEFAVRNRMDLL